MMGRIAILCFVEYETTSMLWEKSSKQLACVISVLPRLPAIGFDSFPAAVLWNLQALTAFLSVPLTPI